MTITRSAIDSTSCSTCELTMIVRPSSPRRWNRSMRCRRWIGSAPLSGSSSTSTVGSFTRAAATLDRWRIPLLNPSMLRSATARSSTTVEGRLDGPPVVVDAVEVGDVAAELAGSEPEGHGLVLGDEGEILVDGAIAPRVAAPDRHLALVHGQEPGDGAHQRGLAGAVGTEQAGDARAERAAQLGDGDLLAEPHRARSGPRRWRRPRRRGRGRSAPAVRRRRRQRARGAIAHRSTSS